MNPTSPRADANFDFDLDFDPSFDFDTMFPDSGLPDGDDDNQSDPALAKAQEIYAKLMQRQLHMLAQFINTKEEM
jgi:hypothetical protein